MVKLATQGTAHPSFIAGEVSEYRYFFLDLNPARNSALSVACGGWERCAPNYRVDRADFGFYGLEYVSHGQGILSVNGVRHPLMPGSVFAYRPLTSHTIQTDPKDPLVKFFVDFDGTDALDIIGQKVLGRHGLALLNPSQPVHDLYEQLIEAGLRGGDLARRICSVLLKTLSLRIEENASAPAEAHNRARQTFEKCRGELQQNFRTIRSIAELARRTHLTSAYLSRLFDRFSGEGPYEMLLRLKMNEAAAHLMGGHYTVKEAGAKVSYPDAYHFSRVFKKCYGLSPSRFRSAQARRQVEKIKPITARR